MTAAVNLQPVQLLSGDAPAVPAETMAMVMGWRTTEVDADNVSVEPPTTLLPANQKIVSNEACSIVYGGYITGKLICAKGVTATDTTDTCQGDSAGPLTIAKSNCHVQAGLSSFGGTETRPTCGDPNVPRAYASVAALSNFTAQNATDATFTTLKEENAAPVLTTSISGTNVTISWSAFAGASGCNLFCAPFPAQALWQVWTLALPTLFQLRCHRAPPSTWQFSLIPHQDRRNSSPMWRLFGATASGFLRSQNGNSCRGRGMQERGVRHQPTEQS